MNYSYYWEQVLSGRKAIFEFSYATPQGTEIPCEARLVRLPSNSKLLVRASITDISARKRAEQELVQARDAAIETARLLHLRDHELTIYADRLREAIRITNTGIFEHDHLAGTMYFSPELSQVFGLAPGPMEKSFDFLESVVEDDRQALLDRIHNVHSGVNDGQFQHIYRVRQPTGKIIWVEGRATTFFGDEGEDRTPVRTVGAVVDITERVAREEFLRENKRYLQAILESTNEIVFSLDMNLRYLAFNRHHFEKMKEVYGVEISIGSCISDFLKFGRDQQLFEESFRRALKGERFTVVQPYGDIAHSRSSFEVTFNPMRNEVGDLTGVAVFARDTSEQIRAQNALRESEELQRLAIEVSELGIWKFNSRTRRFFLDARSQQLLGFSRSIVSEAELASHIHPDDLKNVLWKANGEPAEEGIFKVEHRVQTPEGKCRWVTVCATRLEKKSRAGEGAELEYIGTLLDVTERVETSNLLTSSLKEKDAMLKEIHHRVKNNLQVISSLLSLQAGEVQTEEVRLFSQESQRRVRAMALVHETLYQSETLARIDIAQYVKELCDNIIQSYGPERAIVVRTVDDLQLELDQALPLGLILSELIANAYKHAFPARTESGHIAVSLKRHSKSTLELSVVDDGVGLPVDLDPETHGSLGLKLVKLLTQQLRGQLTIANANGASFKIEIPYV